MIKPVPYWLVEEYVMAREEAKLILKISDIKTNDSDWNGLDDGGMVVFRLVNGDKEKFLHLFNCHNGYYGHGFEMKIGDSVVRKGTL